MMPFASVTLTVTGTTRPTSVSVATEAVAVTRNWVLSLGNGESSCAAWSRCTRLSRPSTTGESGVGDRPADRGGEHRGPAAPDEGIGNDGKGWGQW